MQAKGDGSLFSRPLSGLQLDRYSAAKKDSRPLYAAICCGLLCWIGYAAAAPVAESTEERFLAGLRQRRLFGLAEKYCQSRLADSQSATDNRGLFTLELIRTLSEHAIHSPPDRRQPLWEQADAVADTFLRSHSHDPQTFLVKTQRALTALARGELNRLEAEVAADPDSALQTAQEAIRDATKLLETLAAELTAAIPARRRGNLAPEELTAGELTAEELTSLLHSVRFQLVRAARNQGLSYPAGSPDRIAALTHAMEQIAAALRELAADDPLARKMHLESAICQRQLRDREMTDEFWQALDVAGIPAELRLAGRAERVRWHLGEQRPQPALQVLALGREIGGEVSPELDFAHLETYVALWQAAADAKQTAESNQWRDKALQAVQLIEQTHGPYWGRRAEILLVRVGGERSGGSLEILRRAADDFYLKGQLDEALATFDKAAAAARAATDSPAAFELAYKAGLVAQQRQQHVDAGRRFRELSLSMPTHPSAANAHLLAIVNEAQAWKSDPARREQYVSRLDEHLAHWPYSPTANSARLWLGNVREREQAWQPAIAAYRAIFRESEQFLEGIRGVDRCSSKWLQQLQTAGENVEPKAHEVAQWLESAILGSSGKLPDQWTAPQRAALLAAARIRLSWLRDQRLEIEQRLQAAQNGLPPPAPEWSADAQALLVVAVAAQPGRESDARTILAQIPQGSNEFWLGLVQQLSSLQEASPEPLRSEVAKLQLAALDRLPNDLQKLPAEGEVEVARLRGKALFTAGQQAAAVQLFADLAQRLPQDGEVQSAFAEMLLASPDRADWQRALDQWRMVASKSPARSPRWFRAKYSVALTQFKLGDKSSAAKLIRYLQATENLAASGLQQEFLELLKQCEGSRAE